jgi:hypothetical protein
MLLRAASILCVLVHFDAAIANAREGAAKVGDIAVCDKVLNGYLKAWRKGHLWVDDVQQATTSPDAEKAGTAETNLKPSLSPTINLLSGETLLLTLRTFAGEYRQPSSQS